MSKKCDLALRLSHKGKLKSCIGRAVTQGTLQSDSWTLQREPNSKPAWDSGSICTARGRGQSQDGLAVNSREVSASELPA